MARESSLSGDRLALLLLIAFIAGRCSTELDGSRQPAKPVAFVSGQSDIVAADAVEGGETGADAAMKAADAAADKASSQADAAVAAASEAAEAASRTAEAPPSPGPPTFQRVGDQSDQSGDVYYPRCSAARAAGAAPIHIGEPGYAPHLDRDHDGIACE